MCLDCFILYAAQSLREMGSDACDQLIKIVHNKSLQIRSLAQFFTKLKSQTPTSNIAQLPELTLIFFDMLLF